MSGVSVASWWRWAVPELSSKVAAGRLWSACTMDAFAANAAITQSHLWLLGVNS